MERFWAKVDKGGLHECWEWRAALGAGGYGQFWDGRTMVRAHRFSFQSTRGMIPAGMVLDHLCGNRKCVNPSHLEAVTPRINAIRAKGKVNYCAHRTKRDAPCDLCIASHLSVDPGACGTPGYKGNKVWRYTHVEARNAQRHRYYSQFGESSRLPWTQRENDLVLAHDVSDRILASRLNRSVRSIQIQRSRLKATN